MTGRSGFGMCFGLAAIFYMPRSELYNPVPRRELWTLLGVLVLFVAARDALKFLVPNSTAKSVERVFRHPAHRFANVDLDDVGTSSPLETTETRIPSLARYFQNVPFPPVT